MNAMPSWATAGALALFACHSALSQSAPVQTFAPAPYAPPAFSPDPADTARSFAGVIPAPAPAPALSAPTQCQIAPQMLTVRVYAEKRSQIGNKIRIRSGSYVSPWIEETRDVKTLTFPAPPGMSSTKAG